MYKQDSQSVPSISRYEESEGLGPGTSMRLIHHHDKSTGFSPFQLHIGRLPWLIPPITPAVQAKAAADAVRLVDQIHSDVVEAKDNLMLTKVFQADQANRKQGPEDAYAVNNFVMLSTANQ